MKKLIFLAAFALIIQTKLLAQGQNLWVQNNIDCDIYVLVYASCPDDIDCIEYTAQWMLLVPAHTTLNWTPSSYPWANGTPPHCANWQWYKADISIASCGPTGSADYVIGGNNMNTPCPIPPRDATHYPIDECCGNSSPIHMNLFHSPLSAQLIVRY